MSGQAHHTPYHPKWYRPRVSVWWWLQKPAYAGFVIRELSSVFVAFFAFVCLWKVGALARGPEAYAWFNAQLRTPPFIIANVIAFVFVLFHAITWFNLAPAALVLRVSGKRVPNWMIVISNYAACLVLSSVVAWILMRR